MSLKIKLFCFALSLFFFSSALFSCVKTAELNDNGASCDTDQIAQTVEEGGDERHFNFVPLDVISSFEIRDGEDFAIKSVNYAVDQVVFEALFNLVLYYQKNIGDGRFDELDEYFEGGSIDVAGPVKSQLIPDTDMYWYAQTRSKAIIVCCGALRAVEFARENDLSLFSGTNKIKIEKLMSDAEEGAFGGSMREVFGERADPAAVLAAAALLEIYENPVELAPYSKFDTYDFNSFEVDGDLLPEIGEALK